MDDFEEVLAIDEGAPDFTLETVAGELFSLAEHRGEWIVLEFGSTPARCTAGRFRGWPVSPASTPNART